MKSKSRHHFHRVLLPASIEDNITIAMCPIVSSRLHWICRLTRMSWAQSSITIPNFSSPFSSRSRMNASKYVYIITFTYRYDGSVALRMRICSASNVCELKSMVWHQLTRVAKTVSRTIIIWKENLLHDNVICVCVCARACGFDVCLAWLGPACVGRCFASVNVRSSDLAQNSFLFFFARCCRIDDVLVVVCLAAKSHPNDEKLGFLAGGTQAHIHSRRKQIDREGERTREKRIVKTMRGKSFSCVCDD